jgi:hypothetical protein
MMTGAELVTWIAMIAILIFALIIGLAALAGIAGA